jgi:NAD(P)-dependent dehydrogenase (short-subunit alcohol dehydrogenase family)
MRMLDNKVALVTGAASGLGRAVALRFLAEGARVVGFDRAATSFDGEDGVDAQAYAGITGDVRSAQDNQRAVDLALQRFGRLDVFVGNAGIYDNRRAFRSYSPAELDAAFDELFAIDVKGYMLGALAAYEALARTRGSILFTSSVSGMHAGFGGALYVAAKHAINGLTRQLALELAPEVRVNAVAPGYAPTQLRGIDSLGQGAAGGPQAIDLPLQVIAQADDYAQAYVFLASDAASRTASGTILQLDGGSAVRGPRSASPAATTKESKE